MPPDLTFACEVLTRSRKALADSLQGLPDELWHRIPNGFSSHIAWNLGHILVTQHLLVQMRCSAPGHIPEHWIEAFRKGTVPVDGKETVPPQALLETFVSLPAQTLADSREGRLDAYTPFTTGIGVPIASAAEAMAFDAWHEGWHAGLIRGLIRHFQLRPPG